MTTPLPLGWRPVGRGSGWWLQQPVDLSSAEAARRDILAVLWNLDAWARGGGKGEDESFAPEALDEIRRAAERYRECLERIAVDADGPGAGDGATTAEEWLTAALAFVVASNPNGRMEDGYRKVFILASKPKEPPPAHVLRRYPPGEAQVVDLLARHVASVRAERLGPPRGRPWLETDVGVEFPTLAIDFASEAAAARSIEAWARAVDGFPVPKLTQNVFQAWNLGKGLPVWIKMIGVTGDPNPLPFLWKVAHACRHARYGDGGSTPLASAIARQIEAEIVRDAGVVA